MLQSLQSALLQTGVQGPTFYAVNQWMITMYNAMACMSTYTYHAYHTDSGELQLPFLGHNTGASCKQDQLEDKHMLLLSAYAVTPFVCISCSLTSVQVKIEQIC